MKTRKPLWKISIVTTLEAEDAVGEMLGELFHEAASSYYDFERQERRVTVFVPRKMAPGTRRALREGLKRIENNGLRTGEGTISLAKVRPGDWAESWKRHFRPIEVGHLLLVKPSWSKKRPRADQAVVVLDPGLSFGTGQHPTTEYCLQEIVRRSKPRGEDGQTKADVPQNGQAFFDIGTGSGILAIAAAKLGYHPVRAIDFDSEAVQIARANARANGVTIQIVRADAAKLPARPKKQFDFVCANLISDLLVSQRKRIIAQLDPGGALALAGILKSEFLTVQRKFEESGLKLVSAKSKKEWRSGLFCLNGKVRRPSI